MGLTRLEQLKSRLAAWKRVWRGEEYPEYYRLSPSAIIAIKKQLRELKQKSIDKRPYQMKEVK
jgi:hypothetical protein